MKNPLRAAALRLRDSDRYKDAARYMLPYVVPGLAEALERGERLRRQAFPVRSVDDLSRSAPPKDLEQHQYCPLCGNDGVRVMYQPKRRNDDGTVRWQYQAGRCASCSLLYRVPAIKVSRVPDLYANVGYASFLEGKYLAGRVKKYERTMAAFRPFFDEGHGRRLLDFGCGTGIFMEAALSRGFDAYGVDLAHDSIGLAQQRVGKDRAWFGAPYDVPQVAEGGFDVITLWSVMAHFADPLEKLGELRSLLAPGGVLMIYTVNANSLGLKAYGNGWNGFTRNHLMFWEPSTIAPMLRKAGFTNVAFRNQYPPGFNKLEGDERSKVMGLVEKYQNGNMMRVCAINGPDQAAEQVGIERSTRL